MRLTDLSLRALKSPDKNSVVYADDSLTGFGVRVTANGVKSFVLTHGARRQRETIGRVGIISLQDARAQAKSLLAQYTLGKGHVERIAWDDALDEYLGEMKAELKASTYAEYGRSLKRHFKFGRTILCDLTPRDFQQKLDKLRDTPSERFHAYTYLRAFVGWCYQRHYFETNPLDRMELENPSRSRERVLEDTELRKVWYATGDSTYGRIVKLLIITGQRRGEIANLASTMRKDDTITLPEALTKNGIEHTFPVGIMTLNLLPDREGLLFPARGTDNPVSGWSKLKANLDEESGVTGWTLHDLRRTLRTKWEELGILDTVSERYINHISGKHSGIQRVYNRHKYITEMRAAVILWERHLQSLFKA